MEAAPLGGLTWSKSSRSAGAEGNCVEVAALTGHVAVRDSKRPDQAPLIVPAPDWVTFLGSLRQDH